jgi:cell shape-determining protein MreD
MAARTSSSSAGAVRPAEVVAIVALVLLQLLLGNNVSVCGAGFGFLLVAAAVVALGHGPAAGGVAGFAFGLLADLLGSGVPGVGALLGAWVCYALGRGSSDAFAAGWRGPLARFAAWALVYNVLYFAALFLLDAGVTLAWAAAVRVLVATLLDACAAAVAFWALVRASRPGAGPSGLRL